MKQFKFLLIIIIFAGQISCNKEKRGLSWKANYNLPIAISTITLNNFIADSLLENTNGKTGILYKTSLYELSKSFLFAIPDTSISYVNGLPFGSLTVYPNQIIIENLQDIQLPTGQAGISRMIMESGKLKYTLSNRILQPIILNYSIPGAIKNNTSLSINIEVPAAQDVATPSSVTGFIDLTGYTIDLTGNLHNSLNKISSKTIIKLAPSATSTQIDVSNTVNILLSFNLLKPYYAKGYFGQSTIDVGPSFTNLDVFKNIKAGSFNLSKVSCTINIENGVGVDARLKIKSLSTSNSIKNVNRVLFHNLLNKNLNINRALDNPYQASNYNLLIDESNSNIKSLIEVLPDKIGYEMQVEINPLSNISNGTDFIYTDKLLKATMELKIPLNTILNELVLQDTIRINLKDEDEEIINFGKLKLYLKNYFKYDIKVNLFTINDDYSLGPNIVSNIYVKPNYNASNEKELVEVDLNSINLKQLFKTKKLLIKVSLNSNGEFVEVDEFSRIEIQASADFEKTLHLK
jgi:hypothetical protein